MRIDIDTGIHFRPCLLMSYTVTRCAPTNCVLADVLVINHPRRPFILLAGFCYQRLVGHEIQQSRQLGQSALLLYTGQSTGTGVYGSRDGVSSALSVPLLCAVFRTKRLRIFVDPLPPVRMRDHETIVAMSLKALYAGSLKLLMISGGAIATLLGVALVIITHPLTAFKKKRRESKYLLSVPGVSQPTRCPLCLCCVCSPSSVSAGPESGLARVCDCQWDQIPLCLCGRHLQTAHAPPSWLPRGHHSLLTTLTTLTHDIHLHFHAVLVLVALSVEGVL